METRLEAMLAMADTEFEGKSFNGPSLMATLDALPFQEARSTATFEGFSAWEIAIHCAFYKHLIARALGATVEAYPFAEANFAPPPEPADDDAWKATRGLLRRSHRAVMAAARAATPEKLAEIWPTWDVSFNDALSWLCTHDIYHNAQIRSMGLASLRQPKER